MNRCDDRLQKGVGYPKVHLSFSAVASSVRSEADEAEAPGFFH